MLTNIAPRRIAAKAAWSIIRSVSGVCGAVITTASAIPSATCSSPAGITASNSASCARARAGSRATATTRMSNARAARAHPRARSPAPISTSVRPARSSPQNRSHRRYACSVRRCSSPRRWLSSAMNTHSASGPACTPRAVVTSTPSRSSPRRVTAGPTPVLVVCTQASRDRNGMSSIAGKSNRIVARASIACHRACCCGVRWNGPPLWSLGNRGVGSSALSCSTCNRSGARARNPATCSSSSGEAISRIAGVAAMHGPDHGARVRSTARARCAAAWPTAVRWG